MQSSFSFHFTTEKEKFATCKVCALDNKEVTIKMVDGNTTSTTRHLKKFHISEYNKFCPESFDQQKKEVNITLIIVILFIKKY